MYPCIKVIGNDNQTWSIDKDNFFNKKALSDLNFCLTNSYVKADVIWSVWYSQLRNFKFFILRFFKGKRKIVAVITNDITKLNPNLSKNYSFVDFWIYANSKQKTYLLSNNISSDKIFYNPYYVNEKVFFNLKLNKKEISEQLGLDFNIIKDKVLIGSIQKDSLSKDLSKPKWHKNPNLLISMLRELDKSKYMLILAGPGRHFIINQCKKYNIPHLFLGNYDYINNMKIDFHVNNLTAKKINLIYNLLDLYIVSSASEGGPKAVIEASLSQTAIISTNVGMASDLLCDYSIYNTKKEGVKKIKELLLNKPIHEQIIKDNYNNVIKINNYNAYKERLNNIVTTII